MVRKNITVFEPADASLCTGADDPSLDEDGDGYTNADEIAAGTNPCSGGSKPNDNDGDFVSDVTDPDDDNDGIDDVDRRVRHRPGQRADDRHPGAASVREQQPGHVPLRPRSQRPDDERSHELPRPVRSRQPRCRRKRRRARCRERHRRRCIRSGQRSRCRIPVRRQCRHDHCALRGDHRGRCTDLRRRRAGRRPVVGAADRRRRPGQLPQAGGQRQWRRGRCAPGEGSRRQFRPSISSSGLPRSARRC